MYLHNYYTIIDAKALIFYIVHRRSVHITEDCRYTQGAYYICTRIKMRVHSMHPQTQIAKTITGTIVINKAMFHDGSIFGNS